MRFIIPALAVVFTLLAGPAMAIEQPKYRVEATDGRFEVRAYEPYVVAEVDVAGDQGESVQAGFRKLAGYIFGANEGRSKIAMTAPVAQTPKGEKIAMTAPVTQVPTREGRWTVQFMMPSEYRIDSLPKPKDPDVRFATVPARRVAVATFSGVARGGNFAEHAAELQRWLVAKGYRSRGEPTLAQYDAPWTPWFMRRNEVLVEIDR